MYTSISVFGRREGRKEGGSVYTLMCAVCGATELRVFTMVTYHAALTCCELQPTRHRLMCSTPSLTRRCARVGPGWICPGSQVARPRRPA